MAESELSKTPWAPVTGTKHNGIVQTLADVLMQWTGIKMSDGVIATALMFNSVIQHIKALKVHQSFMSTEHGVALVFVFLLACS